jgi:hypothetical protein
MKYFITILLTFILLSNTNAQIAEYEIYKLINKKNFFELEKQFHILKDDIKSPALKLMATSLIHYHSNRPQDAYDNLIILLENYQKDISFNDLYDALVLLGNTMLQINRYHDVYTVFSNYLKILSPVLTKATAKEIEDIINTAKTLKEIPQQKIEIPNNLHTVSFKIKEFNNEKSISIPAVINDKSTYFSINTGTYYNLVTESFAKEYNINITNDSIFTADIKPNYYKIGNANKISINEMTYQNPVFIVIPDTIKNDLGIVGNAVLGIDFMKNIGEVQILPQIGIIVFSKYNSPLPKSGKNMILVDNLPIIKADWHNKQMTFSFNTNFNNILYYNFYNTNKNWIENKWVKVELKLEGIERFTVNNHYIIPSFKCTVGNKQHTIKNINVQTSNSSKTYIDANVGLDFILQFKKTTINFNRMFVNFE